MSHQKIINANISSKGGITHSVAGSKALSPSEKVDSKHSVDSNLSDSVDPLLAERYDDFDYYRGGAPPRDTVISASDLVLASESARDYAQGYYGLLSNFYFDGGAATVTTFAVEDVGTWKDVNLTVDPQGLFDKRPSVMADTSSVGHTGTGSSGDPIVFLLNGLTTSSYASLRASMSFNPDEDGGRLDTRVCFKRHSGTTPSEDFYIEGTSLAMESGAEEDYSDAPIIQFFVGDTIDTNSSSDAGKAIFQVRSDVAGTLSMNEIALFIQF